MRATKDCTSRTSSRTPSKAQATAFTPDFLATIRALGDPPSARAAVLAGPWEAEEMEDKQFAVCRRGEPFSETGRASAAWGDSFVNSPSERPVGVSTR